MQCCVFLDGGNEWKVPAIVTPTARGYMRMAEVVRKSEGFLAVREEA